MPNIVICADGTWNTPDDMEGEIPAPTNVVKIFNALAPEDAAGSEQKKYYHPGVGTDGGWWDRVAGGGAGVGLGRNIMSAYKWLAVNYEPGDKIFLFGFSRGAYTIRSLGGMISSCGLLDLSSSRIANNALWAAVEEMFNGYRDGEKAPPAPDGMTFHNADSKKRGAGRIEIEFVGVWDTVGALGIPDDMALLNLIDDPRRHSFHDTKLSNKTLNARHAVAIDERRQTFAPTLWTNVKSRKDTVKQIWFPGVHSDVGGGYAQTGLADGALVWMIDEVEPIGLRFRDHIRNQLRPDHHDVLHDSLTGVFGKLRSRPRNVPMFKSAAPNLHDSARSRFSNPPLHEASYWSSTLLADGEKKTVDVFAREKWNGTGIYLERGKTYSLRASGQWLDRNIPCGPNGTKDGKFELSELVHVAATGLGKLEGLFGKITGNEKADFWWTKRIESFPWFSLVGVIANSRGAAASGELIEHETFLIGHKCTHTPDSSGYLYCFANDAWQAYDNNRGSVSLTVKRS